MTRSPVCSYNEWGPLEEVVVGRLEGAMIPSKHLTVTFNIPRRLSKIYKLAAGLPYPKFIVRPAQLITCGVPRPPDWVGRCRTSRT